MAGDGPANSTWTRKSGRGFARSWSAGSGESALAGERTRTRERAAGLGASVTWEGAVGAKESRVRERTRGAVGVLGRAWTGTVRRAVPRTTVSGPAGATGAEVGGPAGGGGPSRRIALSALGRDDQTAWRVDGRRGEDPFSIGVDEVTRPRPAIRDVGAGIRTPTLGGASRNLGRTGDVWSGPAGTRGHRSRPGRAGLEPSGRERPCSRPVSGRPGGRSEVSGRSKLTRRAVWGRAELPARYRLTGHGARTELTGLGERSRRGERARRGKLPGRRRSAVRHARAGHELAGRYHPGRNGTGSALLLTERQRSAGARVAGRELALRGHPRRKRAARRERPGRHRTARKLTRLRSRIAGLHAARDSLPIKPRGAGTAGTTGGAGAAGRGHLTRAREAARVLAADERPRSLRTWKLTRELLTGKLLTRKLLTRKLLTRKLRPCKLRPCRLGPEELGFGELRPGAERSGVWLLAERSAPWTSGAGLRCAGLSWAHLAVVRETSAVLPGAVRSSFVPRARVRPAAVGCGRMRAARLRPARPAAPLRAGALLTGATLSIALLRVPRRAAAGKLARVRHSRLLGPVRPSGWSALLTPHGRALHPGTGGRHARPARSVAARATIIRPRPPGRLTSETGPAGESASRGTGIGTASRDGTAAHAVVTRTPGKPRTPIPRIPVTRHTGIASWLGAPADPGVGISSAFVIRPVFGARPPTPAPPPREPCHIIDRRQPGDR